MRHPATLALTLLLAACAAEHGSYPSLALRAAEKQGFGEPVRPTVAVAADPTLDATLTARAAMLERIAAGFTTAADAARRAAAAGRLTVGGDAWLGAQAALAKVDDWRAQATSLAAEVDAAASARAGLLLPPYPALEALRERAAAESDRQARTVEELQALVPAG